MNFLKKLWASRTIKGILAAAVGLVINQAPLLLSPDVLAQYGPMLQAVAGLLQVGGLSTAVYGRVKAEGPITADTPK